MVTVDSQEKIEPWGRHRRVIELSTERGQGRKQLVRDGSIEVWSPRGLRGVEQLLLEALPRLDQGRVMSGLSSDGSVALVLASENTGLELHDFQLDRYVADKVERNFARNPFKNIEVKVGASLAKLGSLYDVIALPFPQNGDRQLGHILLDQARRALRPGGVLYAATDATSDEWLRKAIKSSFMVQGTRLTGKRRRGYVWKVINRKPTQEPERDRGHELDFVHEGATLRFRTEPAVFSFRGVDRGSLALLESVRMRADERVLDIGCGYGLLGLTAARLAPAGEALLIDCNARAAALARHNQKLNEIHNARVALRADGDQVEELRGSFSLVLANAPYGSGARIANSFARRASELLAPRGRLAMVAKNREPLERVVRAHFPHVVVRPRRSYWVIFGARQPDFPEREAPESS